MKQDSLITCLDFNSFFFPSINNLYSLKKIKIDTLDFTARYKNGNDNFKPTFISNVLSV